MFQNYLKFIFRTLLKNKTYSIVNILGLTLGITSALIIFLIIDFELKFDTHHENADDIYRVVRTNSEFGEVNLGAGVPHPLPQALREDFPEIEAVSIVDCNFSPSVYAIHRENGSTAKFKDEPQPAFVEPGYFHIFSYTWIAGNPATALEGLQTVVISDRLAKIFFGEENPIGKEITYDNEHTVTVTGVVQENIHKTDLPFNIFIRYDYETRGVKRWNSVSSSTQCYLRLSDAFTAEKLEAAFPQFMVKHVGEEKAKETALHLQPLSDLHFNTDYGSFGYTMSKEVLMTVGLVGLFLLITACINFINLNTALAVNRSKEIGVRKALGSTNWQLRRYFLGETAFITLLSIIASLALTEIALGQINQILDGHTLALNLFEQPQTLSFLGILFLVVTVLAGFYPAIHLSGFSVTAVLQNRFTSRYSDGLNLRKGLVVTQFAISQALIICIIVIISQMNHFREADMGFDKTGIVEIYLPDNDDAKLERFKTMLLAQSSIENVGFSTTGTASNSVSVGNYKVGDGENLKEGHTHVKFVDQTFIDTYGLDILAGKDFTGVDSLEHFIVNETFIEAIGYGENHQGALGKHVRIWGREAPIGGIVKDFNTTSLHMSLEPTLLMVQNRYWRAGIKIDNRQSQSALAAIEKAWDAVFPAFVFDYNFLDESIAQFYAEEQQLASMMSIFAAVAIIIGAMGLFGLVSYMAARRTKEIGIRKVLGASVIDILGIFSKEFVFLIMLAFLIAGPIAYWFMKLWLADFAYRIELNAGMFLLGLGATALIAFLTVGYRSFRAAVANPVDSLRNE